MKRLIRTLLLTAICLSAVWYYLPSAVQAQPVTVETVSPIQSTVYETVSCTGTLRAADTDRLAIGVPAEILEVYVTEGETVTAGQALLRYRRLSEEEIVTGLYTSEFSERLREFTDTLSGEAILAAAEYYAVSGELPSYFKDFYLPATEVAVSGGTDTEFLLAPAEGTVTSMQCARGDVVSGLFSTAVIEDTDQIVAVLQAPESCLSKLAVGLPVNLSGAAFGDRVFSGTVAAIGSQAITTGGLLGKSETHIEATVTINTHEALMSGLTVRGTIFLIAYQDAIIIPHEAIDVDEDGTEFVYRCVDGYLVKTPIAYLYENDDGVISAGGFTVDDLLVTSSTGALYNGCAVRLAEEGEE